jgi:ribose transport system ATP-binding protein
MEKQIYNNFKVEIYKLNKSFYQNKVLFDVDFNLINGEIHGIVGQNGAGKSTLIKILNGVHARDNGKIIINGKDVIENPINPKKYGISTVFQELSLIPEMTVTENIFLGNEPKKGIFVNDNYAINETERIFNEIGIGLNINPKEKVINLDMSSGQIVEIAKSLSRKSDIFIFDEPTASLTYKETELLFKVMRRLKDNGISLILISHYLEDIFKICDRVTVLRDGKKVFNDFIKNITIDNMINLIVGQNINLNKNFKRKEINKFSIPLFEVDYLKNDIKNKLKEIKFKVYRGEIVGIAGLLGSGKTEMLNAIYGFDQKCKKSLKIEEKEIKINNVNDARKNGILIVPEDRKKQALILDFSVRDNILLPILDRLKNFLFFINDKKGNKIVNDFVQKLTIKLENINQKLKSLSGGNQQKVSIAKTLVDNNLKILLLDDPTVGIDIKSKQDIFNSVHNFVKQEDKGVILVSSELSELIENCDRILILKEGKIKYEIDYSRLQNMKLEELLKLL